MMGTSLMKIRSYIRMKEQLIFSLAWGAWLMIFPFQESTVASLAEKPLLFVKFGALAVIALLEFSHIKDYEKRDWVFAAIIMLFGVSAVVSENSGLFQGVFIIFCARRHPLDLLMKTALIGIGVSVSIVVLFSLVGVVDSGAYQSLDGRGVRESLGFEYPSRFPNYVLTLFWTYLVWKRKTGPSVFALGLFAVLCIGAYLVTQTRNPLVFALLTYLVIGLIRFTKDIRPKRWLVWIISSIFIVCMTGIWALSAAYDSNVGWMAALDGFMSKRLVYSNVAIDRNPITLMGSSFFVHMKVNRMGLGYFDSSYLRLLYYFGLIPTLLSIAALTVALRKAVLSKELMLAAIFVLAALHGVMEGQLILLNYSPFLIAVPALMGLAAKISSSNLQVDGAED